MFVSESRRFRSAEFLQFRRESFWLKVTEARTSTSHLRELPGTPVISTPARVLVLKCKKCVMAEINVSRGMEGMVG